MTEMARWSFSTKLVMLRLDPSIQADDGCDGADRALDPRVTPEGDGYFAAPTRLTLRRRAGAVSKGEAGRRTGVPALVTLGLDPRVHADYGTALAGFDLDARVEPGHDTPPVAQGA